ncbi:MAG: SPOR domain-containing protein [Pseudomonadota bacterium]
MSRFLTFLAAMASFGAFAMLIQWGITLSTLDPSDIPVIKKAEGPARVAPDDPGGEVSGSQGLAINVIQSKGEAASTADQVVLAPRANPFQPEDVAGLDIEERLPEATEVRAELDQIEGEIAQSLQDQQKSTMQRASDLSAEMKQADETAMAKAKALFGISDTAPEGTKVAAVEPTDQTTITDVAVAAPADVSAKISTERPKHRPSNLKLTVAKDIDASADAAKVGDVAQEQTAAGGKPKAGTPVIQLGAYLSQEIADQEWARLSSSHKDLLGSKIAYNTKTQANGKTYTRLRLHGFSDDTEAKALCVALKARNTDCLFARER